MSEWIVFVMFVFWGILWFVEWITGGSKSELRRKLRNAETDRLRMRGEIAVLHARLESALGNQRPRVVYQTQSIPKDMVKTLIRLCHPDKHGNSESATKATQWLLAQR